MSPMMALTRVEISTMKRSGTHGEQTVSTKAQEDAYNWKRVSQLDEIYGETNMAARSHILLPCGNVICDQAGIGRR